MIFTVLTEIFLLLKDTYRQHVSEDRESFVNFDIFFASNACNPWNHLIFDAKLPVGFSVNIDQSLAFSL
jgi:hypothetical protein